MITVIIYKQNEKVTGYKVSGHSNADDYGKDIVCASVSVLAINTANSLETLTQDSVTLITDDSGLIELHVGQLMSESSHLLLKAFELGIQDIYTEYSQYIKLEFKEV